jgi:cytochrome o ubiquinol oxidase subunit II
MSATALARANRDMATGSIRDIADQPPAQPAPPPLPRARWRAWLARFRRRAHAWLGALLPIALAGCSDEYHLSFLDPQGPVAAVERRHFYELVLVLGVFVLVPIFLVTPWLVWRYRYGATSSRYAPRWRFYRPLEFFTWAGPVAIVIVLGFLLWRSTQALDPYKPIASDKPALRVQVVGYDWKWLFIYPGQGIASVGELAIPAGTPIALQLTSATVMQSFFIPALGSQIYTMGGMTTRLHLEAARPGRFLGENTMYNGNGFHQQKFTAVAMTPGAFRAWVGKVRATGMPLDERTLKTISQRSTRAQLAAALPRAASPDGNVYLTGVKPMLFHTIVKATMDGVPVSLAPAHDRVTGLRVDRHRRPATAERHP